MAYTAGPFSAQHLYLQWGGKLPGNEEWSCGLRMVPVNTGPWPSSNAATMLAAATTAVQAYHVRVGTAISSSAKLSFVKLNAIGIDGHYVDPGTNESVVADVGGAATGNYYPNQIAMAVSLRTGFSRGPAHAGRFYLPMPCQVTGATGVIGTTEQAAAVTSAETFRVALNAIASNWAVGVMSRKLGAPAARVVTGVQVGRVLDTQRRRRRSLPEGY